MKTAAPSFSSISTSSPHHSRSLSLSLSISLAHCSLTFSHPSLSASHLSRSRWSLSHHRRPLHRRAATTSPEPSPKLDWIIGVRYRKSGSRVRISELSYESR
ncbi:hypothetical protein Sjap_016827 [Stephania japonica]|uniref:Uncharacterized protein n=1 Tax=Stephania japonica TaxID=461633 RepID=A0AAP0I507_9MAGN